MSELINRDAVIIFPKQPLMDWVNTIFTDDKIECPKLMAHDEANVYLIPETDCPEDALKEVKANFELFFTEELNHWCVDDSLWPKKLTWKMFNDWFHYSVQSMVFDVLEEPILKDVD